MFEKARFLCSAIATMAALSATLANADRTNWRRLRSQRPSKETTRPLPGPNETWESIRQKNLLYVDKTPFLMKIGKFGGGHFLMRRPPRFGKSMFLDMMRDFFSGQERMFDGLKIGREGNTKFFDWCMPKSAGPSPKWTKFPVVHLKFTELTNFSTTEAFEEMYRGALKKTASRSNVGNVSDVPSLVRELHLKFDRLPVIALVDEYDYPFRYALMELKNDTLAQGVKESLNVIFGSIGKHEMGLGLAFVTGVFKFRSDVPEDGIAGFRDLTFDRDLAAAFGFTEDEIETELGFHLKRFVDSTPQQTMTHLKRWYGGYRFSERADARELLNPVSVIRSLNGQQFRNYRTSTACMDYLVRQFYENDLRLHPINRRSIYAEALHNPSDWIMLPHWMLLFGYLTISGYDKQVDVFRLKLPNAEVLEAVEENLAAYDPVKRAYFADCYRADLERLKKAAAAGNSTAEAVSVLRQFRFRPYRRRDGIDSEEVSKRLEAIFRSAGIHCRRRFRVGADNEGADVRLRTTDLHTNYVVAIKPSTALRAAERPTDYIGSCDEVSGADRMNLLGLGFVTVNGSARLNDWIVVPCENGNARYSDVQADPEVLKENILKNGRLERARSEINAEIGRLGRIH